MSTKCTLDHGDGFHLYVEMFEAGKVYLELEGAEFVAWQGGVTVAVPIAVWDRIRARTADPGGYGWECGPAGIDPAGPVR